MTSFEQGFAEVERAADLAVGSTTRLLAVAKQLQKAAKNGDLLLTERLTERIATLGDAVREELGTARTAWPFGMEEEEEYLRTSYEAELLAAAADAGLNLKVQDGRLVCSPSIVRLDPAQRAVRIDRRKVTSLRPSALVAELKANQARKPRFRPQQFIESLYKAYRLLGGREADRTVVPLRRVYDAFTLLPGSARDYDLGDFARDVYLLDRSGVNVTASGAEMDFPTGAGANAANVVSFVTEHGDQRIYYRLRFLEARR
jgi:hypothetical protein